MSKKQRKVYYGFPTFRSINTTSVCNSLRMGVRVSCLQKYQIKMVMTMQRIRMRLSMMLHIGWVTYLVRILIALSVLLNVVLGGRLNQTFSARNWEWKRNGKTNVVRLLDALLGDGHCSRAWAYWKVRRKW